MQCNFLYHFSLKIMNSTLNWGREKVIFQMKDKVSSFLEKFQLFLSGIVVSWFINHLC